ncbi:MAG: hypothetical protein ACI304_09835 [Lepagella sp.]
MNTNYENERTQYEDTQFENTQYEETQYDESQTQEEVVSQETPAGEQTEAQKKKSVLKRSLIGAGAGLLVGGVATLTMGMAKADSDSDSENGESDNNRDHLSNPDWVDDQIQVATGVTEDMSFGEAFAAARAEVGPGGCFEWHGNVYGTYTADEWNGMSAAEQNQWSDHFSWNHIDSSKSNVAQHSTHHSSSSHTASVDDHNTSGHSDTTHEVSEENHEQNHNIAANDDDIEVISVNHDNPQNHLAQNDPQPQVVEPVSGEAEVEVLGVVHDAESGTNVGAMMVDGQEVVLIDVDDNLVFDYMASDVNHNNQVDQNEIVDIHEQGLTVNDLGGFSDPAAGLTASNDLDASQDMVYEG